MKYQLLYIIILFHIIGCNISDKRKSNNTIPKLESNCVEFCELQAFNGTIHTQSLIESFYIIFDSINRENYYVWKDYSLQNAKGVMVKPEYKQRIKYKYLHPQELCFSGFIDSIQMFHLSENEYIIPFNCEEETTVYTIWDKVNKDSIKFRNTITPIIGTKYSCSFIEQIKKTGEQTYIVSRIKGGEGGEYFETVWVGKFDGKSRLERKWEQSVDYDESESKKTIEIVWKDDELGFWEINSTNNSKKLIISYKINTDDNKR